MTASDDVRSKVLRAMKSIEEHVSGLKFEDELLGAALIEAGLRAIAQHAKRPLSAAERKLVRAHYPEATGDEMDAHRVTPEALHYILDLTTTAARKYLDHQPETCVAPDARSNNAAILDLVVATRRYLLNSFASAERSDFSGYDVAAANITNASILARQNGVCLEQLATIHLEAIQHALERTRGGYGV